MFKRRSFPIARGGERGYRKGRKDTGKEEGIGNGNGIEWRAGGSQGGSDGRR